MTVDLNQTPLRYGGAYDELSADGVTPRPHWAHLMQSLQAIGPEELGRRWGRAERRIRETVGGFYKHFDSRDQLVAEAVSAAFGIWQRQKEAAESGGQPLTFAKLIDDYLSDVHRKNQIGRASCRERV